MAVRSVLGLCFRGLLVGKNDNVLNLSSNSFGKTCTIRVEYENLGGLRFYCSKNSKQIPELEEMPYKEYVRSWYQKEKGRVYDKKPFKFLCEKGKVYMWCTCGYSHSQPFCDRTHAIPAMKIKMHPLRFTPKETREYWFCNCKQTNNRPFCDGSHRNADVTLATSVVKQPLQ